MSAQRPPARRGPSGPTAFRAITASTESSADSAPASRSRTSDSTMPAVFAAEAEAAFPSARLAAASAALTRTSLLSVSLERMRESGLKTPSARAASCTARRPLRHRVERAEGIQRVVAQLEPSSFFLSIPTSGGTAPRSSELACAWMTQRDSVEQQRGAPRYVGRRRAQLLYELRQPATLEAVGNLLLQGRVGTLSEKAERDRRICGGVGDARDRELGRGAARPTGEGSPCTLRRRRRRRPQAPRTPRRGSAAGLDRVQ